MRLALVEQTTDKPQRSVGRTCDAQFAERLFIAVDPLNILVRVYEVTGIIVEIIAVSSQGVIKIGIVRIVACGLGLATQMSAGDSEVPVADLAFDGQSGLDPLIAAAFGVVLNHLKLVICLARAFLRVAAFGVLNLAHYGGLDRPVIVKVDAEGQTCAIGFGVVIVFLDQCTVILGNPGRCISTGAEDIVDITAIIAVPTDQARSRAFADGNVQEAFVNRTKVAMGHIVDFHAGAAVESGWIGCIGHQLQRTSHRAGAV